MLGLVRIPSGAMRATFLSSAVVLQGILGRGNGVCPVAGRSVF